MTSEEVACNVYQLSGNASEIDVEIHDFQSRCGSINYLDAEAASPEPAKVQGGNDDFNLFANMNGGWLEGGKKKVRKEKKEEELYDSLASLPDADVKAFIETFELYSIASSPKPNSIFIIPDKKTLQALEKDMIAALGKVKPDTPEGIRLIKTLPLSYKSYVLDVYGASEKNEGFEYRVPTEYPDGKFKTSILRRTARNGNVYFVELEKSGMKISCTSDMKNSTSVKLFKLVGRRPNYISYVLKGVMPEKKETKEEKTTPKKKTTAKLNFISLMKKYSQDHDFAAYRFVANCIKKFGEDKCAKYYSGNMLRNALGLLNAYADEQLENVPDFDNVHEMMNSKYETRSYNGLNATNMAKVNEFNAKFQEGMRGYMHGQQNSSSYNLKKYVNALTSCYAQIGKKNAIDAGEDLAGDIGYGTFEGIYEDTKDVDMATSMALKSMSLIKSPGEASQLTLNHLLSTIEDYAFTGYKAQGYFPMLYNLKKKSKKSKKSNKAKPRKMTGGDVEGEITIEEASESVHDEQDSIDIEEFL